MPSRPAILEALMRFGGLGERKSLIDLDPQLALLGEGREGLERGVVGLDQDTDRRLPCSRAAAATASGTSAGMQIQSPPFAEGLERAQPVVLRADQVEHDVDVPDDLARTAWSV